MQWLQSSEGSQRRILAGVGGATVAAAGLAYRYKGSLLLITTLGVGLGAAFLYYRNNRQHRGSLLLTSTLLLGLGVGYGAAFVYLRTKK